MSALSEAMRRQWRLVLGISALGISSVLTQIALVRELLNVYAGNELVLGISVSLWLLLIGAGALLGRFQLRQRLRLLIIVLSLIAVLPFVHVAGLRLLRGVMLQQGARVDLMTLLAVCAVLLAPYCLCSGYLLATSCDLFAASSEHLSVGAVYFVDSLGDVAGGVLFSFVLAFVCGTYASLYVPAALCLGAALLLAVHARQRWLLAAPLAAIAGIVYTGIAGVDRQSLARGYAGQEILTVIESRYGRIVVGRSAGQITFFENGVPVASEGTSLALEAALHCAMSQVAAEGATVLLVSGALEGSLHEVLKYPVAAVHYAELDPAMARLAAEYRQELCDPRVQLRLGDARRLIERSEAVYDAILLRLPPPESMQLNRFYTTEFFAAAHRALTPGGMLSFSLPGAQNYVNDELAQLYRTVYASARAAFTHVELYALGAAVFVASDRRPVADIAAHLQLPPVALSYLHEGYLAAIASPQRMAYVRSFLEGTAPTNSDLAPLAFRLHGAYWLSQFGGRIAWMGVAALLAGAVLCVAGGRIVTAMATTGFASIGLELAILLMFQAAAGYIYYTYGVMLALFMAGLAVGGYVASNAAAAPGLTFSQALRRVWLLDVAMALAALSALALAHSGWWRLHWLLYPLMAAVACITGAQFPWAARVVGKNPAQTSSSLYMADMLGSGIGALLCAVFVIPALGLRGTLLIVVAVKLLSVLRLRAGW